ncbi:hypothetical protein EPO15_18625 [bacterium]|nr:MAG: hypothetical protein EPO15_18625 [bacterium]
MKVPDVLYDRRGFQPAGFIVNMVVIGMLAGGASVVLWFAGASPSKVKAALWLGATLFFSGMFYWAAASGEAQARRRDEAASAGGGAGRPKKRRRR